MEKSKYACDICDNGSEYSRDTGYFGCTQTHGYCDNPECKKIAYRKTGEMIMEEVADGNFDIAEELVGDGDIFEFI